MTTSYTSRVRLQRPGAGDRNWGTPVNANADALDAVAAVGDLVVKEAESPSASLNVRVGPGYFTSSTGAEVSYAGTASLTLSASTTTYLWLTDAGVLTTGASFPALGTAHVPLASVVTSGTVVTSITDRRPAFGIVGVSGGGGGAPASASFITKTAEAGLSAEQSLGALTTGLLKNTVSAGTGTLSTAIAGTDYYAPGGTDVAVADGGTGQSTYTDGQLLIGNTSTTGLTKTTLTAGSGITVTNGGGSITITATGGGTGTVTSVALTTPSFLAVAGSPVTTSGTLAVTLATQAANVIFAGPTAGGAVAPTFRALVAADIPNLDTAKLTTGTMATARLGSGTASSTTYLRGDSTWASVSAAAAGSNGQVQYNSGGAFAGAANITVGASANINLVPQAAPGTPTNGDVWSDSTNLALYTRQSATTGCIPMAPYVLYNGGTVANTTAESGVMGTGNGSRTFGAGFLSQGKEVFGVVAGIVSCTGSPTLTINVKRGAVLLCSGTVTLPASLTNAAWRVTWEAVTKTTGASGTMQANGTLWYDNGTGGYAVGLTGSSATINTTTSGAFDVTVTWGTAAVGNTITSQAGKIQAVNS